jgi:hypothetical protein
VGWINADSLAGLVTLANYERPTNDNVIAPFASECQTIWMVSKKEKGTKEGKCVVGSTGPAVRKHFPADVLSFFVAADRFAEMAENTPGSVLEHRAWTNLMNERKSARSEGEKG